MFQRVPAPRFFVVASDMHGKWDTEFLRLASARFGQAPKCPNCGEFVGQREWLDPRRVSVTVHGEAPADFAFGGAASDFIVSVAAVAAIREEGVQAFEQVNSVEVAAAKGWPLHELPMYVEPRVPIGAALDVERSTVVTDHRSACQWCGPNSANAIGPIALELSTWSGEDLFVPRRLPGIVIASERFVAATLAGNVTGIRFERSESYRWDPLHLLEG